MCGASSGTGKPGVCRPHDFKDWVLSPLSVRGQVHEAGKPKGYSLQL